MRDRCTNDFLEHVMSSSRVLDAIHGATESASDRPARPSMAGRSAPQPMPTGHRLSAAPHHQWRSEEHTAELQSLMCISYAVCCLKKKQDARTYLQRHTRYNERHNQIQPHSTT